MDTSSDRDVLICDVGPRDGLQNDAVTLPAVQRAQLSGRLADAGLASVEVASFVSARRVPAMADPEGVVATLPPSDTTAWSALVLSERGYERAVTSGLRRINFTFAVTDAFCERNQGCSRADAEQLLERLATRAAADDVELLVTLAVSFGCPFSGPVGRAQVLSAVERCGELGLREVVVADTIGVAVPRQVIAVVAAVVRMGIRAGVHLHDTRSTGIANALAAVDAGAHLLDSSIGGTGGCPFAPGATGNIATEDLVYALEHMGIRTGIELESLRSCSQWLGGVLGRELPSAVARAGDFPVPA